MKLPYGLSDFQRIRTEGYYYVDKTRYLETLENLPESYIVLLRSRRFGKSLFISMLTWYYDRRRAAQFDDLFRGLYIHAHPTPQRNSYLILSFDFSGIDTRTQEDADRGFTLEVRLSIELFLAQYCEYFSEADRQAILAQSRPNELLSALFQYLRLRGVSEKVYVLIDEYDHFANNILSRDKTLFKDLVRADGYVRPFYEALKRGTKDVVARLFITGVLPILLDSLTSGFNIAKNKSTELTFNGMLGFTEDEVLPILRWLGCENRLPDIRTYYNGYRFNEDATQTVYNSDMILYYGTEYDRKRQQIRNMVDINVVSDYSKIQAVLGIGDRQVEETILSQIVEEGVVTISEIAQLFTLTHDTEFRFDFNSISSLLFYMGYLTIGERRSAGIELRIPNLVLKSLYWDYMRYMLQRRSQLRVDDQTHNQMMRDLLEGKIDLLIELTERLLKGLSNRDYERFDEKYIKVVMLSLLSNVNYYIPRSEYEVNADGYVDLYLQAAYEPETSASYFIELKYVKARAAKAIRAKQANDGIAAMQTYLKSAAAQGVKQLQAYVLVFQKDRCVEKIRVGGELQECV